MSSYVPAYVPPGAGGAAGRRGGVSDTYQIDFTAVASGKRIASTKRRVRWRFGFTNQEALASGMTGTDCRGEEHDITLVWSLTSGKRLVLADGQEVHYSNSRSSVFEFSWTMRGNHVLKVIAHASPPIGSNKHQRATPFRQYDFFIDGQSFFNLPKVYRLGLSHDVPDRGGDMPVALATSSRHNSTYGGSSAMTSARRSATNITELETPTTQVEEEAYLAEAIKNSLKVNDPPPNPVPTPAPPKEENLLDFFSEPAPAPTQSVGASDIFTQPDSSASYVANGDNFSVLDDNTIYSAPQPFSNYSVTSAPVQAQPDANGIFAAASPQPASSQQTPYSPFDTAISTAQPAVALPTVPEPTTLPPVPPTYPAEATPVFPVSTPSVVEPASVPVVAENVAVPAPPPTDPAPAPVLTMAPPPTGLGADANSALEKFAKMDQFEIVSKSGTEKANPFDSLTSSAPAPTLAGMKAMSGQQGEKKPVMNASPSTYAGSNALVMSNTQTGNWSGYNYSTGVPPMQSTPGQGYGQMQNQTQYGGYPAPVAAGGYAPQQQQAMYGQSQQYYAQPQQPPPAYGTTPFQQS